MACIVEARLANAGLVFAQPNGRPINPRTDHNHWKALLREALTRALDRVTTDDSRAKLREAIAAKLEVDPLDALHDASELISPLASWQWQTIHAARRAGGTLGPDRRHHADDRRAGPVTVLPN